MTPTPVGMRCPECSSQHTVVKTIGALERRAKATQVLIAINVLAFVAEIVTGGAVTQGGGSIFREGALYGPAVADGQYWRLITSGFLHANFIHIAFNMWILWAVGEILEPAVGTRRFLIIYFVSLLCGSFGALLLTPNLPTIGASGAVFGVMGASLIALRSHGFDPMRSGIGITLLLNLGITFVVPGISVGGHIGGLIGGLLSAWLLVVYRQKVGSEATATALCTLVAAAAVVGSVLVV